MQGLQYLLSVERIFKPGENELYDLVDSVNMINDYFAEVGDKVAVNIEHKQFVQRDDCAPSTMVIFTLIDEENLLKIVGEFNVHKSSRIKDIPTGVLIDVIRAKPDIKHPSL